MSTAFIKALKASRKEHRERGQISKREKFGFLEKGKDWKERRDDFHKKEHLLKTLAEKAANRNPDEFYFGMIKTKTKDGKHIAKPTGARRAHTGEELALLKTQDHTYIDMKRKHEKHTIALLQEDLHMISAAAPVNKHTIFVDSVEEAKNFEPAKYFDTVPELVNRRHNRPRIETLKSSAVINEDHFQDVTEQLEDRYEELGQRVARLKKMDALVDQLTTERHLMGKGKAKKVRIEVDGKKKTLYKWAHERSK